MDYYILRTSRALLDTTRVEQTLPDNAPLIGWSAMAAWIAGSVVGLTVQFGIPSFNSIVVAGIIHLVLSVFSKKIN